MAEMMAENYHNIWAKKKKMELEAKGNIYYRYLWYFTFSVISLSDVFEKNGKGGERSSKCKLTKRKQKESILKYIFCDFYCLEVLIILSVSGPIEVVYHCKYIKGSQSL